MQLSVFLTPIFAKQIGVGFGVCEELAVFSQFSATTTSSSSHSSVQAASNDDDMSGMSVTDMPQMMKMQSSHSAHSSHHVFSSSQQHISPETITTKVSSSKVVNSTLLKPHVEPHHQNHAKCEFCLLLGHSVLPPMHVVIAILLTTVIAKITVKANVADAVFLNQNKNLRPQGRAPPQFIS